MRYVAAYLLAALGGNDSPCKADVTKILESVGLDIDNDRLDKVNFTPLHEPLKIHLKRFKIVSHRGVFLLIGMPQHIVFITY